MEEGLGGGSWNEPLFLCPLPARASRGEGITSGGRLQFVFSSPPLSQAGRVVEGRDRGSSAALPEAGACTCQSTSTEWPPYLTAFGLPGRARTPLRAGLHVLCPYGCARMPDLQSTAQRFESHGHELGFAF